MSTVPQPGIYVQNGVNVTVESAPRKALFLDRDGVINVNHGYVCSPERTDWVPGIFELCVVARDAGYALVVVTNQAGIARGYYTEAEFLKYTRWMCAEFAARGLEILATVYCPHHPTAGLDELRVECKCRKPASGMFTLASELLNLSPCESLMAGDREGDLIAADGAGIKKGFLIESCSLDPFKEVIDFLNHED